MRRRRARVAEPSLFAFQDVMAAVVGILFVLILLLSLSRLEQPPRAESDHARDGDAVLLEAHSRRLAREIAAARSVSTAGSPEGLEEIVHDVRGLAATLEALHRSIARAQEARAARDARLLEAERALDPLRTRVERQDAALKALEERLQRAARGPRVAYILDSSAGRPDPWLVEVTDSDLRIASRDGAATLIRLGGSTSEAREERLFAWVSALPRPAALVLLIKPSGVSAAERLVVGLARDGIPFGTDLLPEGWEPFESR